MSYSDASNHIHCDVCGRFISMQDWINGAATRVLLTPDSHFTRETYETLCAYHTKMKYGFKAGEISVMMSGDQRPKTLEKTDD